MIYSPYPRVDAQARLRSLEPLDWTRVGALAQKVPAGQGSFARFQLEMLAGSPSLRLSPVGAPPAVLRGDAAATARIAAGEAADAAARYAAYQGHAGLAPVVDLVPYDQWTVGGSRADRPFYLVRERDASGTEIYVSSRTGMVVQATTRRQRFWGWLGAVPHWLYPTVLRSQPQLWSQVVICTSLVGMFLTVLGLIIGVRALVLSAQRGHYSPYPGVMLWHYLTGLVFGVFALTSVLSGLLSMNPWGLMEGGDVASAQLSLTGGMISRSDMLAMLQTLGTRAPPGVVAVESAPLDGRLFVVATRTDGSRVRYDTDGRVGALSTQEIDAAVARVAQPGASWTLLRSEDTYHYSVLDQLRRSTASALAWPQELPGLSALEFAPPARGAGTSVPANAKGRGVLGRGRQRV
jgi:hypothetical protein